MQLRLFLSDQFCSKDRKRWMYFFWVQREDLADFITKQINPDKYIHKKFPMHTN